MIRHGSPSVSSQGYGAEVRRSGAAPSRGICAMIALAGKNAARLRFRTDASDSCDCPRKISAEAAAQPPCLARRIDRPGSSARDGRDRPPVPMLAQLRRWNMPKSAALTIQRHKRFFHRTISCFRETDAAFQPRPDMLSVEGQILHVVVSIELFLSCAAVSVDRLRRREWVSARDGRPWQGLNDIANPLTNLLR